MLKRRHKKKASPEVKLAIIALIVDIIFRTIDLLKR